MIKWDQSYSTGNSEVDSQHKVLFDFFNDMETVIAEGRGQAYLSTGLPILENYARTHFDYESKCMHQCRCPVAELNDEAHEKFLKALKIFKEKLTTNGFSIILIKELHSFLESWLKNHIMKIDNQLRDVPPS